jgi:hypothetical protein
MAHSRPCCFHLAKEIFGRDGRQNPEGQGLQPNPQGLQPNPQGLQPNPQGLQQNPEGQGLQQNPQGLQQNPQGLQQNPPRPGVLQSAVFLQPRNPKYHIYDSGTFVCIGDGPRRLRYTELLRCEQYTALNCLAGGQICDGVVSLYGLHNHD